jgi:hypothetical protein
MGLMKCDLSKYALLTKQTKVGAWLKLVRTAYLRTNMIILNLFASASVSISSFGQFNLLFYLIRLLSI